jgi:hypothetical protein
MDTETGLDKGTVATGWGGGKPGPSARRANVTVPTKGFPLFFNVTKS